MFCINCYSLYGYKCNGLQCEQCIAKMPKINNPQHNYSGTLMGYIYIKVKNK